MVGILDRVRSTAGNVIGAVEETAGDIKDAVTNPGETVKDGARGLVREGWELADRYLPPGSVEAGLGAAEKVIDLGAKATTVVAGEDSSVGTLANNLSRVDLEAIARDDELKGDWGRLWGVWLSEDKPQDLGPWDQVTNPETGQVSDRVTITDPAYTGDLAGRPHQQQALDAFLRQHEDPQVGDQLIGPDGEPGKLFEFTGEGTAEGGDYTAVEWFMGSYRTNITCVGKDPATGKPILEFEATNESHWESATRVPASGQDAHLPNFLIPDQERGGGFGVGGDFQQRFVWRQTVDVPAGNQSDGTASARTGPIHLPREHHVRRRTSNEI